MKQMRGWYCNTVSAPPRYLLFLALRRQYTTLDLQEQ